MKKPLNGFRRQLKDYWRNLMKDSGELRMSRGGANISRFISWARSDNWRRNATKSAKKFNSGKK